MTITPTRSLTGEITAPSSKAQTHRALVAGLLSEGTTIIINPLSCDDTEATASAVSALGGKLTKNRTAWTVDGRGRPQPADGEINCRESGVTLRFMIPIASLTGSKTTFRVSAGLARRPLEPLADAMKQLDVNVAADQETVRIEGGAPRGGVVRIRGDVSSQFISGLLFAGPLMENGLRLESTSPLESRSYASLTIETMRKHGTTVRANRSMTEFEIKKGQRYSTSSHRIGGDFSSAAFLLAAAAITSSKVIVHGLSPNSPEPDSAVIGILRQMGAHITVEDDGLLIEGGKLKSTVVDIRDSPDLGPVLAVLGCCAEGESRVTGALRLRYKESDRLATVTSELKGLGADVKETDDGFVTRGPSFLSGGVVRAHGDHRVAMALSIAALGTSDKVTIEGAECVSKSYPNFFDDLRSLGVEVIG